MVIFLNMDGSCENVSPQHVYQGSNNVTDVTVVAPYAASTAMQIGFILPSGLYWQNEADGARYMPMEFIQVEEQYRLGVWRYVLQHSVTEQNGELKIAINAITGEGNTTSYMCTQIIQESVLPNLPSAPEPSVYDLLQRYIANIDERTESYKYLVKSIQKVAGNAFTYTNNSGVVSEPIVLTGKEAPIPVNAGSKVVIPADAWTYLQNSNQRYKYVITAAMHGQMRDGATANDLWVSIVIENSSVYQMSNQDYSINSQGDIILLRAILPTGDTTVRVWNGKSIVDATARQLINTLQEQVTAVGHVIPADASSVNRLTTESDVRDLIASAITTTLNTPV